MSSKTNRNLQRNHDKSIKQRREAGKLLGEQFAEAERPGNKARQLHLRNVTAFVHRVYEATARELTAPARDSDPVMVPYMPHRSPRKVTPAQRAYVNFEPFLIKSARS